eukprot:10904804-Lingulodinium_polyedra.AAC.1
MGPAASPRRSSQTDCAMWLNGGHPSLPPRCSKARLILLWHPPPFLAVWRSVRPGSTANATAER